MDLRPLYMFCMLWSFVYSSPPWPYLQVYPPLNASDNRTPLYIALMLTTDGFRSISVAPGVQLALDYINNDLSFLPGYTLHYTLVDTLCDEDVALEKVILQLNHSPVKLGWLGSGCSVATAVSAALNQLYNLTQVSCLSSSPLLSNRELYRYYFQMQSSSAVLGRGFAGIANIFQWKRIALIIDLDPVFSALATKIKADIEELEIEFSETLLSETGEVYRVGASEDGNPFDENMRLFVLITGPSHARWLACQAFLRRIKYPRNQFILFGDNNGGWLVEHNPMTDLGCTLEERIQIFEFALSIPVAMTNTKESSDVSLGGLVPLFDVPIDFDKNQLKNQKSFMKSYYQKASSDENQDLRLNLHPNLQYFTSFSITCYEATFTIAKALKMTLEDIHNNHSLNMEASREVGLLDGEIYSLANFSYSNGAIAQRMFYHLSSTDFVGMAGRVRFDENGITHTDEVVIMQFTPKEGVFDQELVGKLILSDDASTQPDEVIIMPNLTNHLYWPVGIPHDGRTISNIVTVSVPVTVIFVIAGITGIVFAISFGIFNFIYRKKRIIRLSSPKLNYLIVVGAINFYLSAIGLVTPSTDPDVVASLCFINLIIIYTGYSLCYGTIMVKMFRVWYIFNNHTMKKKIKITDFYLGCAVMTLVGLDLCMILIFVAVQGLRDNLAVHLVPNGEEPITLMGPTEIVQENCVYACDSEGRFILIILLYCSKILLQICSLILAFCTRNVKVKGLDDSKYIPAAIYISTIVLPISLAAAFAIRTHVDTFPVVLSSAHIFGATSILVIVFVPRMIGLYKDPTGINVFDNRYTAPNYDENDVVALRRDIQQLRVTLHFAQKNCKCSTTATSDDTVEVAAKTNDLMCQTLQ